MREKGGGRRKMYEIKNEESRKIRRNYGELMEGETTEIVRLRI